MENSFTSIGMSAVQIRGIHNRTIYTKSEKSMTAAQLKQFFVKFGQIEDFRQNDLKTEHYILFASRESAVNATQEQPLNLTIQLLADKKKEHVQAVYITNLPLDVSESVIHQNFIQFGPIQYVRLNKDVHGELNGFGYVSYSTMTGFNNALEAGDIIIQEKVVRIRRANSPHEIEAVEKELPKVKFTDGQKRKDRKEQRNARIQEKKIQNLRWSSQIDSNMEIILDNRLRIAGRVMKKNIKKLKEKNVNVALGMKKYSEKLRKRQDEIFFKKPSEMKKRRDKRRLTILSNVKKANKLHLPYKTGISKSKLQATT